VVHQHQSHSLVLPVETAKKFKGDSSGLGAYYSVRLPVPAPQVALHRPQNIRIVIDC
jgi:hypothetical protein